MIDLRLLRRESTLVKKKILAKDPLFPVEQLVALDQQVSQKKLVLDSLLQKSNKLSEQGRHGVTDALREESRSLSGEIESAKAELAQLEHAFDELYLACPNLPVDELPLGGKEANQVVKVWGVKPQFSFNPSPHYVLAKKNKWIDFDAATLISKSGFAFYENEAVDVMYQLCMGMVRHNRSYGYKVVIPPFLANKATLTAASNLPRFKDEVFVCEKDDLYLIPTAEVALAGLHRDTIFQEADLPLRYTAWTSCFRREAGGYGAHEKGLIRMHQFEKVELFALCAPQRAAEEQERMLSCAESILQKLNLHYQVVLLATGDCSFASARTYDIEVWLPGQNEFREISSISNCTDFQARRAKIRYKEDAGSAPRLVYTLNGSSLALSRLMVALMETYQKEDGSLDYEVMNQKISMLTC